VALRGLPAFLARHCAIYWGWKILPSSLNKRGSWYGLVQKTQSAAFVNYNLLDCAPLPFSSDSIELAYTSHTIEHVPDAAVRNLFNEIHRGLNPGGLFRVTCPDADLLYWATRLDRREFWTWRNIWFERRVANSKDPPIEEFFIR